MSTSVERPTMAGILEFRHITTLLMDTFSGPLRSDFGAWRHDQLQAAAVPIGSAAAAAGQQPSEQSTREAMLPPWVSSPSQPSPAPWPASTSTSRADPTHLSTARAPPVGALIFSVKHVQGDHGSPLTSAVPSFSPLSRCSPRARRRPAPASRIRTPTRRPRARGCRNRGSQVSCSHPSQDATFAIALPAHVQMGARPERKERACAARLVESTTSNPDPSRGTRSLHRLGLPCRPRRWRHGQA
jgi:hypothetical protein